MKSYLKENYLTVKLKSKTLWTTLIITKVIYVSIWIAPIVIGITWWKVLIGFVMHYCRINLERCFQLAHVVEETTNPSPNELGEIILGQFTNCSPTNFAPKKRNCKLVHWWFKPSNRASYIPKHQSHSLR
jgi:linoleoyl-CoA desaturase